MGAKQRMGDDLLIELWCNIFFPFSFSRSPYSVPGSRSPFLVSRSPFSFRRFAFCVLRFSVSLFPVRRFPLPRFLFLVSCSLFPVPRFSLFFSFISYLTTKRLFGSTTFPFRMKKQSKVRTSRCLHVLTDGSGRVKTIDSVTLWFQRQNLFSPLCMLKYISQESVLYSLHRREHLQVYSAKGGKL